MSIETKHAYRFIYLKSDAWEKVRLDAIVRDKGICQICGVFSISNDAHHVWYPKDIYETEIHHLVVLCRPCHTLIHAFFDKNAKDRHTGWNNWKKFSTALKAYRTQQANWFLAAVEERKEKAEAALRKQTPNYTGPKELRKELERLKAERDDLKRQLEEFVPLHLNGYIPNYQI